jgi:hypothetical protein
MARLYQKKAGGFLSTNELEHHLNAGALFSRYVYGNEGRE